MIGRIEAFPPGTATPVTARLGGREIAILVVHDTAGLRAFEDACPHQYLPLSWRGGSVLSADGRRLRCASHGAEFCARDGRALTGPGTGEGLTPVPLRVAPDGTVHVAEAEGSG
ncbi:Rieske 2Fe-2S domain-containing protein [Roseomonas sp. NAR14]|uniref:Rieske 2Fe-2S domain-containing protein n=1 Tax=Roseomonas acroporae TaxID=2937791 RepID=A0A9X1YC97_9PROT|nr:Rieske 2Fe-2S domain-containing protein [Roseomonas acroporae]MCK8787075.1 Rieske 2Fe-2S domain-containing protein [Roseomonas acroporae]